MTKQRRGGYYKMTRAKYNAIKEDIPNHPKLAKKIVRLAEHYRVSDTTMGRIVRSKDWTDYRRLTTEANTPHPAGEAQNRRIDSDKNDAKPIGLFDGERAEAEAKRKEVEDAAAKKPASPQAVAAAVAASVTERALKNQQLQGNYKPMVVSIPGDCEFTVTEKAGVTIVEAKKKPESLTYKAMNATLSLAILAASVIIIGQFLAK